MIIKVFFDNHGNYLNYLFYFSNFISCDMVQFLFIRNLLKNDNIQRVFSGETHFAPIEAIKSTPVKVKY